MVSSIGATSIAVARQDGDVVLGVLADLQDGRVFQQRLQPRDGRRPAGSGRGRPAASSCQAALVPARGRRGCSRPRPARRPARRRTGRRWPTTGRRSRCRRRPRRPGVGPGDPGVERRQVADADIGVGVDGAVRRRAPARRPSAARRRARRPARAGRAPSADPARQGAELHLPPGRPASIAASGSRDRQLVDRRGQRACRSRAAPAGATGGSGRRSRSGSGGACPA